MRPLAVIFASVVAVVVVVGVGVGLLIAEYSDSEVHKACEAGRSIPEPKRTPPPSHRRARPVAWLGPRYGGLRFHSVSYGNLADVNYGEPVQGDPCSGGGYFFAMRVLTAPRRPETRRRLRRSLGPGVPVASGTRYGCQRSSENPRVVLLRTTIRMEVIGATCDESIAASRKLRLAHVR